MNLPLSILDLVPIGSGYSSAESYRMAVRLAQQAERLGYSRVWYAEHHGMPGVASTTPAVLIAHVAAQTSRIRLGSGGVMLPNHSSLAVAESFRMLEALYPDRIDLGIGRAPGTDPATARALRGANSAYGAERFPEQINELIAFAEGIHPVKATPEDVAVPPIWLLGSSDYSAKLAARLGLGFSFAAHFSPNGASEPMRAYREGFQPSAYLSKPYAILTVSAVCAETDEQADRLASSMDLQWVKLQRGEHGPLPSPEEAMSYDYSPIERMHVQAYRALSFIGTPDKVLAGIAKLAEETKADEVMISTMVHGHEERLRSFELIAEALGLPRGRQ
ncbi:LLM class flavin-dependent oxidoreductase [Paenibacillus thermoaerophilus]|uniref:LLM class flavin-dependent oxidoreductase n=1 Tax=Paenibacillus thermoaerophilus TaxID=1215385 RepID=A0ABW2V594_9BACL|nr:LLM class flavin-dependent oxidoreductase [Paenibacillus thermoaerophilus]TMV18273.1 LLM class flavin-dependent oxidoreductase [Paenibacillus thermoaerophilus]